MSSKLVTITPENAPQFKAVRLAALQDSPTAFGSTYAREAKLSDADWIERSRKWSGDRGIGYFAMDANEPCGIALGLPREEDPTKADLISMWVAPTHRRSGVGRSLINGIAAWSKKKNIRSLYLMVTSSNDAAMEFYKRTGFEMTGRTEPYPNDPALFEYEMYRSLA